MKYTIKTPYGATKVYQNKGGDNGCILVVPGFSESILHNQPLVDCLAKDGGYDVFTFDQPRRGPAHHPIDRQKAIIVSALEHVLPNGDSVHAIAHSLGSVALLRAAATQPERFLSLFLMQPPGIYSQQGLFRLARRVSRKSYNNHFYAIRKNPSVPTSLKRVVRSQLASSGHVLKNPRLALKEANFARRTDLLEDLSAVQALGIPTHIMNAHSDELFGNTHLLEYEQIIELVGPHSSVLDEHAGHDTSWLHPERTTETVSAFIRHTNGRT